MAIGVILSLSKYDTVFPFYKFRVMRLGKSLGNQGLKNIGA
jgi:hypothetical protein